MDEDIAEWLGMSQEDLAAAALCLEHGHLAIGTFLCQLAVEKAMKAVWLERTRTPPPLTHDLVELQRRLQDPMLDGSTSLIEVLSRQAVRSRYSPSDAYNREQVQLLLRESEALCLVLHRLLS